MFEEIREQIQKSDDYINAREKLVDRKLVDGLVDRYLASKEILSKDPNAKLLLEEMDSHKDEYGSGKIAFESGGELEVITTHMYDENGVDLHNSSISSLENSDIKTDYKLMLSTYKQLETISTDYNSERSRIEQEKISSNTI